MKYTRLTILISLLSFSLISSAAWAENASEPGPVGENPAVVAKLEREKLSQAIESVLKAPDFGRTKVGILAIDVATGETLYARNEDELFNPASNVKLITAAAVLDILGPGHTFTTTILANEWQNGTVDGPLYVKSDGEAFLLFSDVMGWAAELQQKGVQHINGDIIIDDTVFDGGYIPPGFDQKDADASYRSPIGAVSVNFNAVTSIVSPAPSLGEAAVVRIDPPNRYIDIVNQTTTARGSRSNIRVSAIAQGERTRLLITGSIGQQADPILARRRIDHPPLFAGSVLQSALEMVGITFNGVIKTGSTPAEAKMLVEHRSQPVSAIISAMNKWSNNFMAEQLLRSLGGLNGESSTWEAAKIQVVDFLTRMGFNGEQYRLHNGSGLYDGNAFSPRQFVQLLRAMIHHPYGPEFMASLPISAVDGTLRTRLQSEATQRVVRAKTGTLNEVVSLSGYLRTKSGRQVAFSILFNDTPTGAWNFRRHQDAIVEHLVAFDH